MQALRCLLRCQSVATQQMVLLQRARYECYIKQR